MSHGKTTFKENVERVYEIYGIPTRLRRRYSIHHIVFKSDKKYPWFKNFDINQKSNLCPLTREEHRRLHRLVEELGEMKKGQH